MIVECRPDGVAVSPSQPPSGGLLVCDPPAIEVEAMDADGPTISPAIPSSSAPVIEEKKQRAKQAITSIRDPESGVIHHDPFEILGTWQRYYHRLFTADVCDKTVQDVMLSRLTRSLSPVEIESCEGLLTLSEC